MSLCDLEYIQIRIVTTLPSLTEEIMQCYDVRPWKIKVR